jgi:hypothetical protein
MKLNTKVKYIWPTTKFFNENQEYIFTWLYDMNKPIEVSCNKLEYFSTTQTNVRMEISEFTRDFIAI